MKRQKIQDERVLAQHRKISSEAYGILMIMLLVSILLQQFLLNAPFEQYAAEFICFFGISIYIIVRYMMHGLNIFGEGKRTKKILLVSSIITGITVTVMSGIVNYIRYAEHYKGDGIGLFIATLVINFISATALVFIILLFFYYLNKKKQGKIQKQLDQDEQNE